MDKKTDEIIIAYHQVFNTEAGRAVLRDMLRYSKLLDLPGEAINSEMLLLMEGRRQFLGHILRQLDITPDELLAIRQQREQKDLAYE